MFIGIGLEMTRGGGSSTNPPLANLAAWYSQGQGITSVAGAVSQWNDQSGNGRHLVQAVGARQPALQADGSIVFDGIDDSLQAIFALNQPETVFMRFRQLTWGGATLAHYCDGGNNNGMAIWAEGVSPEINGFAGNRIGANGDLAVGAYGIVCGVFDGVGSLLQVNAGGAPVLGDSGANNGGGFTIGDAGNATGAPSHMQITDALVYSAALDATQRAAVFAFMGAQ